MGRMATVIFLKCIGLWVNDWKSAKLFDVFIALCFVYFVLVSAFFFFSVSCFPFPSKSVRLDLNQIYEPEGCSRQTNTWIKGERHIVATQGKCLPSTV